MTERLGMAQSEYRPYEGSQPARFIRPTDPRNPPDSCKEQQFITLSSTHLSSTRVLHSTLVLLPLSSSFPLLHRCFLLFAISSHLLAFGDTCFPSRAANQNTRTWLHPGSPPKKTQNPFQPLTRCQGGPALCPQVFRLKVRTVGCLSVCIP